MTSSNDAPSELRTTSESAVPPDRTQRVRLWVNWSLALLTVPAAALVMIFAMGAVMSTAACSTVECPNLGPSGFMFDVLYYGAPVISGVTLLVSMVTAGRRKGIVVPLVGLALLIADVVALAVSFKL